LSVVANLSYVASARLLEKGNPDSVRKSTTDDKQLTTDN